jgi:hypothetical protein
MVCEKKVGTYNCGKEMKDYEKKTKLICLTAIGG